VELYIIRHLQTDWNRQGLLQGSNDIDILPIDDQCQRLIERQKQRLVDSIGFEHVIVSELQRTHQTAAAYGFNRYTVEPLINELNFGRFEGRSRQELITAVGQTWFDDPRKVVLGESIEELSQRIKVFLRKYSGNRRLLIFAHGSWTRAMISFVECGDLRNMNQIQVANNQLIQLSCHRIDKSDLLTEQACL